MIDPRTVSDPTALEALAAHHDALVELARENPHAAVIDALIARLYQNRPRFFWPAAVAIRAQRPDDMPAHLRRTVTAPDRDTSIGRRRLEDVCRCFESDPDMQVCYRDLLALESTPGIAIQLLWSLVHGGKDLVESARAIRDVALRLGAHNGLRSEAARALGYCDARAREAPVRALLASIPPAQKRSYSAYAKLVR